MNLDLSLLAYLFGESFNQRLNENKKIHENNKANAIYYCVKSQNRLSYLFSTENNSSITTSHVHKIIVPFHEFTAKVHLIDRD